MTVRGDDGGSGSGHRLLASGRDADILDAGPGLVVRRSRIAGRSLAAEAEVMEHVRQAGFPVPRVEELRADGTELVMERLEGPSMMALLASRTWRMNRLASQLAELHRQLGAITAPASLRQLPGGGDAVVHLDLHPLNVIMTRKGPYVIDWTNAARGRKEIDVAATWVIVKSSEIPEGGVRARVLGVGRNLFLGAFLRHASGVDEARAVLPMVIEARQHDRNLTERERRYLDAWLARLNGSGRSD